MIVSDAATPPEVGSVTRRGRALRQSAQPAGKGQGVGKAGSSGPDTLADTGRGQGRQGVRTRVRARGRVKAWRSGPDTLADTGRGQGAGKSKELGHRYNSQYTVKRRKKTTHLFLGAKRGPSDKPVSSAHPCPRRRNEMCIISRDGGH